MTDPLEAQDTEESVWVPKQPVVPSTWMLADFSDAFAPVSVNQRKVPAKTYKASGAIPVVDQGQAFIGGYTDDESLAIDPGEGLIVFGDHTRVFKRVSFRFAAGADGIKVLRPLLFDSAYAYYACKSLRFPNRGYSRHYSFLVRCKIPVAPEPEQKRIVSKIDELLSRIDEGERALERVSMLVERYRQSVLKAAVTGELTREWREKNKDTLESGEALLARIITARRKAWEKAELEKMKAKGITPASDKWKQKYEEPSPPDITGLPALPDGWTWATPVQLESSIANAMAIGPFGSNLRVPDYRPEGVPLIFVRNIRSRSFNTDDEKFVSAEKAQELASHIARAGDVLVTKMGDPPGEACVYPVESPDAIITADCIKWTLHPLLASREYFAEFINSALGRSQIAVITKGVAQQKVSLERFRQIAIALPGPEEQAQIAERLDIEAQRLSRISDAIAHEKRRSSAARQSILRAAFSGMLVGQDPSDEPASTLLERIAAERGADTATSKRSRKKKIIA